MTDSSHQAPAFHEVGLHWWFTDNGLQPYWALTRLLLDADGYLEADLERGDEVWHVSLGYSKSGIAARESDPVDGALYELDLYADGPGEAKASYNVSPRFDDMRKASDGETAKIGWCGGEGMDLHVQGSNVRLDEYHYLLRETVQALAEEAETDLSDRYFGRIRSGTIATLELYVRLKRQYAQKLTRSDGVFYRLMHLMNTRDDASWSYSGHNENGVGKRHAFEVEPDAANDVVPGHTLGRRLKCYHPKHVRTQETDDDPMSSPKFGVAFHRSLNEKETVDWRDRNELVHELEETIANVLEWAGVPIGPDPTVFVEDPHFPIQESERDVAIVSDPTPELEAEQEHLVARTLNDLMPSSRSVLERIATDGGQPVRDIADETGYSLSQVYRALQELGDDVIENQNGLVQLQSEKLRQDIANLVDTLEREVVSTANRVAKLARVETRSATDSAIQKWMDKYGVRFLQEDGLEGEGTLRFDAVLAELRSMSKPHIEEVLEEGRRAWADAGRDVTMFNRLTVEADIEQLRGDLERRTGRVKNLL